MNLMVDDRYVGQHGIARYSAEVLPRLGVSWTPLVLSGKPASALDAFAQLAARRDQRMYSPGYAAFISRQRQLLTVHDLIHLQSRGPQRMKYAAYYNLVVRPAILRAGRVLTVSDASADALKEWIRNDGVEVVNTGNACSSAFTADGPVLESHDAYIVFVGNLRPHKNVGVLIEALALLTDLRLKMVIPRSEQEEARALASAAGVDARVDLLHGLSDLELAALYRGAVATALPSTLEGFGLPALESTCCGTPVLYWKGCRAVADAALGYGIGVEEAENPDAWASAAEAILASPTRIGLEDRPTWDAVAAVVTESLRTW
ncbi:glycosyltransferase [Microbacterium sp. B24]|uniref:glycosyltransferase n=1 Tax=Microbacterium sp. B24 TaxID=95616 RepID=UPI000569824A|nr:glycosyltransferase [Microbacterium sp. B24]